MHTNIDHLENLLGILGLETERQESKLIVTLSPDQHAIIHLTGWKDSSNDTVDITTMDLRDPGRLDGAPNKRFHVAALPAIAIAGICYGYSKL